MNEDEKRGFKSDFVNIQTMSATCGNKSCDLREVVCHRFLGDLVRENPELLMINIGVHILNSFTATFGNLLIMVTIWRTPALHIPSNALLFSLALSDFFVGCIAQPMFIKAQVIIYNNDEMEMCSLNLASAFINIFLIIVTFLVITVISVDRYLAIHFHLRYREIVSDTRIQICIFATWVAGGAISAISFFATRIFQWTLIIAGTICLLIASYIWIRIYLVVKHHQAQIQHQVNIHIAQDQQFNMLRFRKSANRCMLLIFLYLLCYLPQITFLVCLLFNANTRSCFVGFYFCYTFVAVNSSLNPLVYCWRHRDISTAAKQFLMKISWHAQVQEIHLTN